MECPAELHDYGLHLIQPLWLFKKGALSKNVSGLLAQQLKETCVPDAVQLKAREKTRGVIMTDGLLKLRGRLSTPLTHQLSESHLLLELS